MVELAAVAVFGLMSLVLMAWVLWLTSRVSQLEAAVARLGSQATPPSPPIRVGVLTSAASRTSAAGSEPMGAGMAEVRGFLLAGQKLNAIKRYRELTGVGLKEAKDAVEAMVV